MLLLLNPRPGGSVHVLARVPATLAWRTSVGPGRLQVERGRGGKTLRLPKAGRCVQTETAPLGGQAPGCQRELCWNPQPAF